MSLRDLHLPDAEALFMREINEQVKADGCRDHVEWAIKHPGEHLYATFRTKVNETRLCKFCCGLDGAPYRCPGPWELHRRGESS